MTLLGLTSCFPSALFNPNFPLVNPLFVFQSVLCPFSALSLHLFPFLAIRHHPTPTASTEFSWHSVALEVCTFPPVLSLTWFVHDTPPLCNISAGHTFNGGRGIRALKRVGLDLPCHTQVLKLPLPPDQLHFPIFWCFKDGWGAFKRATFPPSPP